LLDFLGLPTLIVTDLDPVGEPEAGRRKSVTVHASDRTSNACIKDWFDDKDVEPLRLIELAESGGKTKNARYLAFQVPEQPGGACGRTFEDSFVLANPAKFSIDDSDNPCELEASAGRVAGEIKKSDFALRYAINDTDWTAPRYLKDGLIWLRDFVMSPPTLAVASVEQPVGSSTLVS
ncbi:MAG: ATP-dependent endonuclease, partial [Acidimicrobiales bacterium]